MRDLSRKKPDRKVESGRKDLSSGFYCECDNVPIEHSALEKCERQKDQQKEDMHVLVQSNVFVVNVGVNP